MTSKISSKYRLRLILPVVWTPMPKVSLPNNIPHLQAPARPQFALLRIDLISDPTVETTLPAPVGLRHCSSSIPYFPFSADSYEVPLHEGADCAARAGRGGSSDAGQGTGGSVRARQ
jgi:hypothetical protein